MNFGICSSNANDLDRTAHQHSGGIRIEEEEAGISLRRSRHLSPEYQSIAWLHPRETYVFAIGEIPSSKFDAQWR